MFQKIALLFVFYIPFQIALSPTDSVDLASLRVFSIFLFAIWIIRGLYLKKLPIPYSPISFFLYIFIFFTTFSLFFAENQLWGLRKLAFIFSFLPIYFVFSDLMKDSVFKLRALKWLTYGSFIVAAIGLTQFTAQFIFGLENVYAFWANFISPLFLGKAFSQSVLTHSSWLVNISGETVFRAISIFPDPHMFSFYMGMTTPIALSIFLYTKNNKFLIFLFFIILASLLSFSRGGYIGLSVAILFFLLYVYTHIQPELQKSIRLIFYSLPVVLFIFLSSPFGARFLTSFNINEGSNSARIQIWKEAVEITTQNPFGVGIGNYSLEISPSASYRDPFYAHNLYLDISSELGILALIAFILVLILIMLNFLRAASVNILYIGPLLSMIVFTFHSLFDTPLYSVHVLTLFFIILSLQNNHVSKNNN